jgi:hypothetical protein
MIAMKVPVLADHGGGGNDRRDPGGDADRHGEDVVDQQCRRRDEPWDDP